MTIRVNIVIILLLSITGLVNAQERVTLSPILSSQHGVRIDMPTDWQTIFFEADGVILSQTDDVLAVVYLTDALNRQGFTTLTPVQLIQQIAVERQLEEQEPEIIDDNGVFRNVLYYAEGALLAETYGLEDILLIDVHTDDVDEIMDTLLAVLDSLDAYEESIEVENYSAGWRVITAELLAKGYIREGDIIQSMPTLDFMGEGNQYTPIAESKITQDILVGATINLKTGADDVYETCGIMSRVVGNDTNGVSNFLEVGVDSDGDTYIFDRYGSGESDATLNYGTIAEEGDDINIVYKLDGGLANVFVNGQLVFSNLLIQERQGYFGASFVGHSADSSCVLSDIWFYEMGSDCTLTVSENHETYFSPDETEFALGELTADTPYVIDAVYLDDEMTPWWRVAIDARWIHGDDVVVAGSCGAVDFVENLADVN